MNFKFLTHFHVRFLCNFNGFQNRNPKLLFYNPHLDSLDTDIEVGYLYEFVFKLHVHFDMKRLRT